MIKPVGTQGFAMLLQCCRC